MSNSTASATKTFFILHGEDEFSLKQEVRQMKARMGDPSIADLNITIFDGKNTTAIDVLSAAENFPFLSDKRLVICEGLLSWYSRKGAGKTGKNELEALAEGLKTLPETTRLVFVDYEKLDEQNPVLKAARGSANGFIRVFEPPHDTVGWINKRVQEYGGQIEPKAAAALAAVMGKDVRAIDSECFKLVTYAGTDRPIREEDVALMTAYVPEARIWDIVDALGMGNSNQALTLIQRLMNNSKEEPIYILSMINRQFRLLIQVREVIDAGLNPRDIAGVTSMNSSKLIQQARRFTLEQLESVYHLLLDTDHDIKSGVLKDDLALELLIARITE
ncbi:MAG: DNA polymerase III subunit delta [Anaerolineae bacterium]